MRKENLFKKISRNLRKFYYRNYKGFYWFKWFLIWAVIYVFLIWILQIGIAELSKSFDWVNNKIVNFFVLGFGLALFSGIISSAIHKKRYYLSLKPIYWTIIFSVVLWFIRFILNWFIENQEVAFLQEEFGYLIATAVGVSILISFFRRAKFTHEFRFSRISGVVWIIILILLFSLSIKLHFPYGDPISLDDFNLQCVDGKVQIKNNALGLGKWATDVTASVTCLEYKSSRCKYTCYNEKPSCQCEAVPFDLLFSREYGWFFDGW